MKNIDITGASRGVGRALADQFVDREDVQTHLIGGRNHDALAQAGNEVQAASVHPGDLFQPGSLPYQHMMESRSQVIAHAAAINIDTIEDPETQNSLRELQNAFLKNLIENLKHNNPDDRRLFLDVNSVTSFFARANERARAYPYMRMKMEQADILSAARSDLQAAGIELVVVYPGAIRTEMLSHIPDDAKAVKLANMMGKRVKTIPGYPEGFEQDRIFQPKEVAGPLAKIMNHFLVNGEISTHVREYIMGNSKDLELQIQ